mmetsp:Transcript_4239/g.15642  ORF Transcript_4239/g.15642 Transcript_4239/m.15642 type:complete len:340 (-) Transcript_4239:650-1669(-)
MDVRRLKRVQVDDCAREVPAHAQAPCVRPRRRVLRQQVVQAATLTELEHHRDSRRRHAEADEAHDVRVAERRVDLRLLREAGHDVRRHARLRAEHLDRDRRAAQQAAVDVGRGAAADEALLREESKIDELAALVVQEVLQVVAHVLVGAARHAARVRHEGRRDRAVTRAAAQRHAGAARAAAATQRGALACATRAANRTGTPPAAPQLPTRIHAHLDGHHRLPRRGRSHVARGQIRRPSSLLLRLAAARGGRGRRRRRLPERAPILRVLHQCHIHHHRHADAADDENGRADERLGHRGEDGDAVQDAPDQREDRVGQDRVARRPRSTLVEQHVQVEQAG